MGRPSFPINQLTLKAIRNERGLTQEYVASQASKYLGTEKARSRETLISDYQRIERTGRTSRKTAEAIARTLNVSVEMLQGEEVSPPDYIKRLSQLLRAELVKGTNIQLQNRVEWEKEKGANEPLKALAVYIGSKIEAVQLTRNPVMLNELVALTGLPKEELLRPAAVTGQWFVQVIDHVVNQTDIFRGDSFHVFNNIEEKLGDIVAFPESDASIRLSRDGHWFRIEITHPRSAYRHIRVDFVRCIGDKKGIRWTAPSIQDIRRIPESLKNWAYSTANFVTDFDGKQFPGDLQKLRLLVTKNNFEGKQDVSQMIIKGRWDEMPSFARENFKRTGSEHYWFIECLRVELKLGISPLLAKHPADEWKVSAHGSIDVRLESRKYDQPGVHYSISLVEETSPNEFVPAPWRQKDKDRMKEEIKRWILEP